MSAQACYPGYPSHPGDPYPWAAPYPTYPGQYPTYQSWTSSNWPSQISEDRIREIFREELAKAIEALKESK